MRGGRHEKMMEKRKRRKPGASMQDQFGTGTLRNEEGGKREGKESKKII